MIFHLLIVDDEPTIRKGLASFISWETLHCVVDAAVCDGAEAIEQIRRQPPDIVITDIRMPQVDGIELARFLHEHAPEIKVIILTGYADFQYAQSALRFGVCDFILKPTSREKLQEAVKKAQEAIAEARNRNLTSEEDLAYLREQFFQEVSGMERVDRTAHEKAGRYGIQMEDYYTAAFQMDEPETVLEGERSANLKEVLRCRSGTIAAYSYGNHLVIWVCAAKHLEEDGGPPDLIEVCEEILKTMELLYAIELSVGISEKHRSLEELQAAVREAVAAGNRNFYEDSSVSVFQSSGEEDLGGIDPEYTLDLCQFENCLKMRAFEGARDSIRSLFSKLKCHLAGAAEVKNICNQIYYICGRIRLKRDLPPLDPQILQMIRACAAISQLEHVVTGMYEAEESLLMTQGQNWNPLSEKAARYIHEHLEETLSLETIAAHVHVNPSHLSRIFKRDCGENVTEYINRTRIERAKELLTGSNLLAYEAAEQVGFHDPAYFSSIFKKYTGRSPKEYKQENH